MAKNKTIKVTLIKGLIGEKPRTRANVRALGLGKIRQTVEHDDNPSTRGKIHKVRHLVRVDED